MLSIFVEIQPYSLLCNCLLLHFSQFFWLIVYCLHPILPPACSNKLTFLSHQQSLFTQLVFFYLNSIHILKRQLICKNFIVNFLVESLFLWQFTLILWQFIVIFWEFTLFLWEFTAFLREFSFELKLIPLFSDLFGDLVKSVELFLIYWYEIGGFGLFIKVMVMKGAKKHIQDHLIGIS